MIRKLKHGIMATAALAMLAACSGKQEASAPPPPSVTVAKPLVQDIVDWDEYVGRFEAVQSVEVRPRISGQLDSVLFRDGDIVRKGQPLFRIDPRPFEAALAEANARLQRATSAARLAEEDFTRAEKLWDAKSISRQEYDAARARRDGAKADVDSATALVRSRKLDVEFTEVRAPITGRVSDRRLTAGNQVAAGQTLLTTIVTVDPIYFSFTGSEGLYLKYERQNRDGTRASSRLRNNPVEIRLQDETGYSHRGTMSFVDNAIDARSGTIRARATIQNADGFLTPGMFGHVRLLGSGTYQGMLVPDAAIASDQAQRILMTVSEDGKVVPKVVEPGPLYGGGLRVIRSGISKDDQIIINGIVRVRPGMTVQVEQGKIEPPKAGEAPDLSILPPPPSAAATAAG